jgi:hypothetical protein
MYYWEVFLEKAGGVNSTKVCVTDDRTSRWILHGRYARFYLGLLCYIDHIQRLHMTINNTLRGFSPQVNYTYRVTAACRRC